MMHTMKKELHKVHSIVPLLILACLFIGVGIGMVLDHTAAGTLIGLGVGFLAAFIAGSIMKKRMK